MAEPDGCTINADDVVVHDLIQADGRTGFAEEGRAGLPAARTLLPSIYLSHKIGLRLAVCDADSKAAA